AERHMNLAGVLGDGPHAFDAPFPFVFRRARAAEVAERRMKWPDEVCATSSGTAIEAAHRTFDALFANVGVRANRIVVDAANGDSRTREAVVVENLAPLFVVEAGIENRQLDAVVTQILEHLDDRNHRVVHLA